MQRRGRLLDNDDDRSVIRRGLQAKPHKVCHPADGTCCSSASSEAGGSAPSDSPPPSLPPGAPSSTAGSSSIAPALEASRGLELVAEAMADILADEEEEAVLQGIINSRAHGTSQHCRTMPAQANPQMVKIEVQGDSVPHEQQEGKRPSPAAVFSPVRAAPQHRGERVCHACAAPSTGQPLQAARKPQSGPKQYVFSVGRRWTWHVVTYSWCTPK